MIASGTSMIEVAQDLKEKGANKVYLVSTFALLTEGPDCFIKAHEEGLFDKLYATNLSYVSDKIKKEKWYHSVDMSKKIARIINTMHNHESLKPIFNGKKEILDKIEGKK